jgi:hypothetical protein
VTEDRRRCCRACDQLQSRGSMVRLIEAVREFEDEVRGREREDTRYPRNRVDWAKGRWK